MSESSRTEISGMMRSSRGIVITTTERRVTYLRRNGILTTMGEMSQAADVRVNRSSTARFSSLLVGMFKGNTIRNMFGTYERDDSPMG